MKYIIIIPARFASTRFPGKPLADIVGKPMIQRVVEQVSDIVDAVWVATDDERIESTVRSFGGNVVMTSTEHQSGTDRIAEALESIQSQTGETYDVVINVQGDEPFIECEQIVSIKKCFENPDTDIATLIQPIDSMDDLLSPNVVKVVKGVSNHAIYFSRSPIPFLQKEEVSNWIEKRKYWRHIGMYAYRSSALQEVTKLAQGDLEKSESLEQLRWLENNYRIATEVTLHKAIGIDTPEDLQKAIDTGLTSVFKD